MDFGDRTDFEDADRGFVDTLEPLTISGPDGRTAWDVTGYGFLHGECPETVNPSLFRQAQLCWKNGLYQVTDGIYQVCGFDLPNMTLVEGDGGVMGVLPDGAGQVPVIASQGFLQHAVSENVYAGIAMARRGSYMAGITLAPGPQGQVNADLGIGSSGGSVGLLAPTVDITHTGQRESVDGVRIDFQLTPTPRPRRR